MLSGAEEPTTAKPTLVRKKAIVSGSKPRTDMLRMTK